MAFEGKIPPHFGALLIIFVLALSVHVHGIEQTCSKDINQGGVPLVAQLLKKIDQVEKKCDAEIGSLRTDLQRVEQENEIIKEEVYKLTDQNGGEVLTTPTTKSQQPTTKGPPGSCELLAQCNGIVEQTKGLHEEADGSILVSGGICRDPIHPVLSRCDITGETAETLLSKADCGYLDQAVITNDGATWVINGTGSYQLWRRSPIGDWERFFQDQIKQPNLLDTDSQGNLMVMDWDVSKIHVVNVSPTPTIVKSIDVPEPNNWLYDMEVLPSGDIAVLDFEYKCVQVISQEGTLLSTIGVCSSNPLPGRLAATTIASDQNGNLFIGFTSNEITVYKVTGEYVGEICVGQVGTRPSLILVTSNNKLVVDTEENGSSVLKVFNFNLPN